MNIEPTNWISKLVTLNTNTIISEMYIPGSSSSCSYQILDDVTNLPIVNDIYKLRLTKQNHTIEQQFYNGVRLFDVRVTKIKNTYYIITVDYDGNIIKHMLLLDFIDICTDLFKQYKEESIFINFDNFLMNNTDLNFKYYIIEQIIYHKNRKLYKYNFGIDDNTKLEKNTLYISFKTYDPLYYYFTKITTHLYRDVGIYYHVDKNFHTYDKKNKYVVNIDKDVYEMMYLLCFLYTFLCILAILFVIFTFYYNIHTVHTSYINKPSYIQFILLKLYHIINNKKMYMSHFIENFVLYFCFFLLFTFLILNIFYFFVMNNYLLNNLYNDEIKNVIFDQNRAHKNFVQKTIIYEMCTAFYNQNIYMRNF